MDIPADVLKKILELRKENGLVATEEAMAADLAKSKASWVLQETPRYRRAGRSPLYISGRYLTSAGVCPATGEKDSVTPRAKSDRQSAAPAAGSSGIDPTAFYKVLHGKGFSVKMTKDLITGELETQLPASITKLDLQFGKIPEKAEAIYISQTTPQIQVSMPIEKFLEISGIKPS